MTTVFVLDNVTTDNWLLLGVGCEGLEGFAVDAHDAPLVEHVGSHLLVEIDGGLVPVEDVPLEAVAAFEGDGSEAAEEGFGDSSAAELGTDEEVFEVDAGVAAPCGVKGEVEGERGGLGHSVFGPLGDEAGEDVCGPKPSRRRSASVATTASGWRS